MKKILFIDRDGTLIHEDWKGNQQIDRIEKYRFLPGCISNLARLAAEGNYTLVMVTNQDGLGTDSFPEESFWPVQNHMVETLESEGIKWYSIHIDRSFSANPLPTRKPGTAMLTQFLNNPEWDLANSFVIGDRLTDVQLAQNLGSKAIYMGNENEFVATNEAFLIRDWKSIYTFLKDKKRESVIIRNTSETQIQVRFNPDGAGQCEISTGLHFFDHMLEQIGRHSGADLEIQAKGDLHIDDHHTIEDVALALGQAIRESIARKVGINRYAFHLPMDESDARVLLDLGGRPAFKWNVELKREKVGDLATENVQHFFKSLSDSLACNLHIECIGDNEHHKIEAVFKAFARALGLACKIEGEGIASTKGVI